MVGTPKKRFFVGKLFRGFNLRVLGKGFRENMNNNTLSKLANFCERVAKGDFAFRAELPSEEGELGRLIQAFDQMAQNLEECDQDREKTFKALMASEVRYRRLFEAAQDGIVLLDAETGEIDDINPHLTSLLGYSREHLLGKKLWEAAPFKDLDASKADFRNLHRNSYVRYDDLMLDTADGRAVSVEFTATVYTVNERKVIHCNLRDINARKATEQTRNEYSRRLQVLSRQLVEAQEAERRHLALELHDEIGQTLTVAQLSLQKASQAPDAATARLPLVEARTAVDHVLEQVRDIALNLRPSMLDDLGLEAAVQWYVKKLAASTGIKCEFHMDPLAQRLDPVIETECFRIIQESLTNVVRHAHATFVVVNLRLEEKELHLRVTDNGSGFDVAAVRERAMLGKSLGLLSMEERATLAGGQLEFISTPGRGAEVNARFPLKWASAVSAHEDETAANQKLIAAA